MAQNAVATAGRIGPNAIVRVAEALREQLGTARAQAVFAQAGLQRHLAAPPHEMVAEDEVRALHRALRTDLGTRQAQAVARDAGRRTAAYLLQHRIPKPVQGLLKTLPAGVAARVLLAAIRRNAWTFVGSGRFSATPGHPVLLEIRQNPLCRDLHAEAPACDYYAATFEALFQALVHPSAAVREVACEACGAEACRFEIRWR